MDSLNSIEIKDGSVYEVKTLTSDKTANKDTDVSAISFDDLMSVTTVTESLETIFNDASERFGVDVNLLKAVAYAESDFKTDAVSKSGAQGIMQLMPYTSEELGVEDPFDARQNIMGGAKLLSILLEQFDGNVTLAVAGYNAGANAVTKYGGVPPYEQTLKYITNIDRYLNGALSNDSRTVEGAKATDLSGVSTGAVNIYVTTKTEDSGQGLYSDLPSDVVTMVSEDGTVSTYNPSLLRFEDYLYVCANYKDVFDNLADKIAHSDNTASSSVMTDMMTDRIQGILKNDSNAVKGDNLIFSVLNSEGASYNTIRTSVEVMESNLLANEVTGADPKTLYEASKSYNNSLASKLLDL
ncbi:MAG: lytic transglycosylase domain-containing protein [Lachnospira sp.]